MKQYDIEDVYIEDVGVHGDKMYIIFAWSADIGFGTLSFYYNLKTKMWDIDNEDMSQNFCIAVITKFLQENLIL